MQYVRILRDFFHASSKVKTTSNWIHKHALKDNLHTNSRHMLLMHRMALLHAHPLQVLYLVLRLPICTAALQSQSGWILVMRPQRASSASTRVSWLISQRCAAILTCSSMLLAHGSSA